MVSMSIEASSDWLRAFLRFEEIVDRISLMAGSGALQAHDTCSLLLNSVLHNHWRSWTFVAICFFDKLKAAGVLGFSVHFKDSLM